MRNWCVLLFCLSLVYGKSQNTPVSVTNYGGLGISTGVHFMSVRNTHAPPLGFEMISPRAYHVGLMYQWNRDEPVSHRLTAGYQMWWMGYAYSGNLASVDGFFRWESLEDGYGFISLGYDIIYSIKTYGKKSISLALGPDIIINQWGREYDERSIFGGSGEGEYRIRYIEFSSTSVPLYVGLNAELALAFNTKKVRCQLYGKYHFQVERSIYKTFAQTTIGSQTPSFSAHILTGNYFGIGLTIQPASSLINRYLEK
jgi:hypothetical protein